MCVSGCIQTFTSASRCCRFHCRQPLRHSLSQQQPGPSISGSLDQGFLDRSFPARDLGLPRQNSLQALPSGGYSGLHGLVWRQQGPFFTFEDGHQLTRKKFVVEVRRTLGYNCALYAGHSFRIGVATTAAQRGMQDSLIKTLGRWESTAHTVYIRTPPEVLCRVASTLASGTQLAQGRQQLSHTPSYHFHTCCSHAWVHCFSHSPLSFHNFLLHA